LGANLFEQLKIRAKSFDFYALAMDESNDLTDTAQLLIFIRGADATFTVHDELGDLCSLKSKLGFVPESTGNARFFGTELGKVEKCNNRWREKQMWF
jgi:hypothetical protein